MLFIYLLDIGSPFHKHAEMVFHRLRNRPHELVSSLFVQGEVMVHPVRSGDQFTIAKTKRLFGTSAMQIAQFGVSAVTNYARLRGIEGLKPLDALHLATASSAKVDLFVTNDHRLWRLTVQGVGRIVGLDEAASLL